MKCPYCVGEVDAAALACPHCTRDLYLFKPMLARIEAAEAELVEVRARLEQVALQQAALHGATNAMVGDEPGLGTTTAAHRPASVPPSWIGSLALWLVPLALLVFAHLLVTMVYDLNALWLRLLSLLIPLPFGYLWMTGRFRHFAPALVFALIVACLAVLTMSGVVHVVDGTPLLPEQRRDWQEFIEYALSICFSFATGMVLGRMVWRRRQAMPTEWAVLRLLAGMASGPGTSAEKLHAMTKSLSTWTTSLAAAGSSLAALYTGFKPFLGE